MSRRSGPAPCPRQRRARRSRRPAAPSAPGPSSESARPPEAARPRPRPGPKAAPAPRRRTAWPTEPTSGSTPRRAPSCRSPASGAARRWWWRWPTTAWTAPLLWAASCWCHCWSPLPAAAAGLQASLLLAAGGCCWLQLAAAGCRWLLLPAVAAGRSPPPAATGLCCRLPQLAAAAGCSRSWQLERRQPLRPRCRSRSPRCPQLWPRPPLPGL